MKIRLVPSVVGEVSDAQFLSSYVINDHTVVDAGSIGFVSCLDRQRAINDVLLTHAHIDHLASLGSLIDNTYTHRTQPLHIYATREVLDFIQQHIFNGILWPNIFEFPDRHHPVARAIEVRCGVTHTTTSGLLVTPTAVHHSIGSVGFLIDDGSARAIFTGDTGPTDQLWKSANERGHWDALVTEVAFPNGLQATATAARHLTPQDLARELQKLNSVGRILVTHRKAEFRATIADELQTLAIEHCDVMVPDVDYSF